MIQCSFLLAVLLFTACTVALPHSIWDISIDESPAPPPDKGPPISAGALRDRSKLKYEVVGIVGAYLFWLVLTLLLVLFVGRTLRRKAQTSNRTLSMEMVKPAPITQPKMAVENGPRSPGKMASLRSWASMGRGHQYKDSNISVSTVDEKVLETDKQRNLDEMAKLYAAVMVHDEERSQRAVSTAHTSPRSPQYPPQFRNVPTPPISPQYPPEFQHLRDTAQLQSQPRSPHALSHPLAPTPSEDTESMSTSRASSRKTKASPLSFISGNNKEPKSRPSRISVRGQPISQPMGSADLRKAEMYSEQTPLSPRLYNPGPPPPTPGPKTGVSIATRDIELEPARRGPPTALSLRSATTNASTSTLPFRQHFPDSLKSAPATKTTFVDRRESILNNHGAKTGVPQTPYSPYMPFTPITPVTPRTLMTRKEMKKSKKGQGLKVLSEDDMVMSDEDMWGNM